VPLGIAQRLLQQLTHGYVGAPLSKTIFITLAVLAIIVIVTLAIAHTVGSRSGSANDTVIRAARVGDCLHVVTDYTTTNADGSHPVTVSKATCGTSDATDKVALRTADPGNCPSTMSNWVMTESSGSRVVLCLDHI
jgi:hypothetical protein